MDNRTFNFAAMYVHTKHRNQCQTHWQAVSKGRKKRLYQVIDDYCLKKRDGTYRDFDRWKDQCLEFIKERIEWARENERDTDFFKFSDQV